MQKCTIGMIGAGNVGGALARRFANAGYQVVLGVRDPSNIQALVDELPGATAVTPDAVAALCDIMFLTVPGGAAVELAETLGNLDGKILVDCTNPMRWDQGPVWTPPDQGSNTAALAQRLPGVRAVKAFNTFGSEFHADPNLGHSRVQVLMAGDDSEAKETIATIAETAGFAPIDAGPLRNASVLENHAILWIHLALAGGQGRNFVFQMTRRDG